MTGFQPDPVILAFFGFREVAFVELVLLLALLRSIVARRTARQLALAALAAAGLAVAAKYLPALLGLYEGPVARLLNGWRYAAGGYPMLLLPSALLLGSAFATGRRWWGIDVLHALILAAFLGLWGYATFG